MNQNQAASVPPPVQLEFDDNRLLPMLFGEHDRNLARIEQTLGVQLVTRGNRLAISGAPESVAIAQRTLNAARWPEGSETLPRRPAAWSRGLPG